MGFYEDFIEKYDKLISWKNRAKRETNFFMELFSQNKIRAILDCACGTGQHVIIFKQKGYDAKGSDLSAAMIRKAKSNSKKYGIKATFKISDFRNLTKIFNEKFDAVICVGNSLPHLLNDKDLVKAIREMYDILKDEGMLILEQRNYDKLLKLRKRFFPVTIRRNEIFFYVLDYFSNKIVFNVVNVNNRTGKFNVYTTEYNALKKDNLVKLVKKVGFKNLKFYQDYKFNKFDENKSDNLIIVCKK